MKEIFFESWANVLRVVLVGVPAYVLLVASLRVSGKRTLSKLNAFDLVVTVALGSTLATILLNKNVMLIEGFAAFGVLIGMQWIVAYTTMRSQRWQAVVKSTPAMLLYRGQFLPEVMRRERIVEAEVLAAVRGRGLVSTDEVTAVVLETDGSLSVLAAEDLHSLSSLDSVVPRPEAARN